MTFLLTVIAWLILLAVSWPLALAVLLLAPFIWLVSLPLRIAGWAIAATLALVRNLFFLPARLLGHRH